MDADVLVRDYLGRLDATAAGLPAHRREELAAEVREHIDAALAEAGQTDEVTVRNILERLGSPEEIVAAEAGQAGAPGGAATVPALGVPETREHWGPVEVTAVVLLCLAWPASFLPFGPLLWIGFGVVGLMLVWASSVWSTRRKLTSTICVVALYLLIFLVYTPVTTQCSTGGRGAPQPCAPGGPSPTVTGS